MIGNSLRHKDTMLQLTILWPLVCVADSTSNPPPSYPNCTGGEKQHMYSVTVTDRDPVPDDAALISHLNGSSDFNFNFATAWWPRFSRSEEGDKTSEISDGLVVRVVECNPDHHSK